MEGPRLNRTIVGFLRVLLPWDKFFQNIIPDGTQSLHLVLRNTCGQELTFAISGPNVTVVSKDKDIHDKEYDEWETSAKFHLLSHPDDVGEKEFDDPPLSGDTSQFVCMYSYSIYPTAEFYDYYHDSVPILSTIGVIFIFVLTSVTFLLYDRLVARRQNKIEITAARSHAIVSSLFPTQVRERLMADSTQQQNDSLTRHRSFALTPSAFNNNHHHNHNNSNNNVVHSMIGTGGSSGRSSSLPEDRTARLLRTKPIADFFPRVTVMFADISGL